MRESAVEQFRIEESVGLLKGSILALGDGRLCPCTYDTAIVLSRLMGDVSLLCAFVAPIDHKEALADRTVILGDRGVEGVPTETLSAVQEGCLSTNGRAGEAVEWFCCLLFIIVLRCAPRTPANRRGWGRQRSKVWKRSFLEGALQGGTKTRRVQGLAAPGAKPPGGRLTR